MPVEKVEAFVTKASDANANKAILVTSSRFQKGCFPVAERHNIGLYTLKEINELQKEVMGNQLIPALNIFDIKLVNDNGEEYIFPEYGGKLQYLIMQTTIAVNNEHIILDSYLSNWIQSKKDEIINGTKEFKINLDKTISASIPQEDAHFHFNYIQFKCKFIEVLPISKATIDPYLLGKINAKFLYKNEITGKTHKINSKDLPLGFDTKFEEGKFYFNPKLEFFYYCESIVNDSATIYLVESYQHGHLFQVIFKVAAEYSKYYIEVTNNNEVKRLKNLLQRMKSKKS